MLSLKQFTLLSLFTIICSLASGQNDSITPIDEVKPEYPGGEKALLKFVSDSMVYPKKAFRKGIQGTVYTQFILNEEGYVVDPVVIRGIDPELDAEALRLIKLMPKWQPGMQRGRPVKVKFTMPLKFKITGVNLQSKFQDTTRLLVQKAAIGVYFGAGYNPLIGSFSDYIGNQSFIEFGTHGLIGKVNFMLSVDFGLGTKTKQTFDANGYWRKGRGAHIYSPQILLGYELVGKGKWSVVPFGGLSLNGFIPSKLEENDPKNGFDLSSTSLQVGTFATYRYHYKDKGPERFNTSLLRFKIGYNYMKFNDFLKGSSLTFSVCWERARYRF